MTNESNNLVDSSSQRSLHNFVPDSQTSARKGPRESSMKVPIYMLSVNNKNQFIYTLLLEDSKQIEGDLIGDVEVVYEFTEIITTMVHLDSSDIILLCGSPHLFFWNVPEKKLIFKYSISVPIEPWFVIWDAIYIKTKQSLILSLNNGFVLQLKFNIRNLVLEDMKVFQSNDLGVAVYSMAYFPSVEKILATNNGHLLTEFVFQIPKKAFNKGLFMASTKNISVLKDKAEKQLKSKSIRNISMFDNKKTFKVINTNSTTKNQ